MVLCIQDISNPAPMSSTADFVLTPTSSGTDATPAAPVRAAGTLGAAHFPVQTAIRTLHGVAIVRSGWADGAWQHRFPSHSQPGQHHITTAHTCDCAGYMHHGRCYHVACAQDIEAQLHRDIYDALRFLRWCTSSDESDFGWRDLARLNISEATAREVLA